LFFYFKKEENNENEKFDNGSHYNIVANSVFKQHIAGGLGGSDRQS
jgi:hypothetical protein